MITLQQLEHFFSETRSAHEAGRASWSIDGKCRWSYFFVDPEVERLMPVKDHLEALGYEVEGTLAPEEGDANPIHYLRVDRIEAHTPESLHERNLELYAIAEQFAVLGCDGMDVGSADGP